jgi:hypothetical protein
MKKKANIFENIHLSYLENSFVHRTQKSLNNFVHQENVFLIKVIYEDDNFPMEKKTITKLMNINTNLGQSIIELIVKFL